MNERQRIRASLRYPIAFSLSLILVKLIEVIFVLDFSSFGILPRTTSGLKGVLFSGFIHGDFFHLFSNIAPIALMSWGIVYFFGKSSFRIIAGLYILTGVLVWLLARPAYHIGASGLVYAMLSFLFTSGVIRKDRSSLAISLTIFVLYGGSMLGGLLPAELHVSWESHLAGFCIGIMLAIIFRKIRIHSSVSDYEVEETNEIESNETTDSFQANHTGHNLDIKYHYKRKKMEN